MLKVRKKQSPSSGLRLTISNRCCDDVYKIYRKCQESADEKVDFIV